MPGDLRQRLMEAEALVKRARTAEEREAFKEIAAIWRRLLEAEGAAKKTDDQSSPPDS